MICSMIGNRSQNIKVKPVYRAYFLDFLFMINIFPLNVDNNNVKESLFF